MRGKGPLLLIVPLLLLGCSLDYHTGQATGTSVSTPDTILYNFATTSVHGSKLYFKIEAAEAENFNKENLTVLKKVTFREYDAEGKVIAQGSADKAVYHTDTKNAELTGNIEMYSAQEKARITTDYLSWDNQTKTLTGKPGVTVTILKDDGSKIEAKGFEADLRTRSIKFSSDVRGTFVDTSSK